MQGAARRELATFRQRQPLHAFSKRSPSLCQLVHIPALLFEFGQYIFQLKNFASHRVLQFL